MTLEEFDDAAELYDGFAVYDREGMVQLVGQLALELIEQGVLDRDALRRRLDRLIADEPDTDDQVSPRLAELRSLIEPDDAGTTSG
ncbi:hypothetical protein IED13_27210 [Bosea sp. SSUT16]|uniref:Uncharacterized protein n=1 Tax=Bosea spartocytisi TaxID=2773451 RepID=A0A927EEH7_9HYPH|nr:hypothetical protein [Bosea spartocytisi]MBD3849405.1 hypothetical protein [Bosea spartocytisi]MCT4475004.1 hypothetical protein [Bosea spartocytisi]